MAYSFDRITPRLLVGAAPVDQGFLDALVASGVTDVLDVTDVSDDTSLLATHPLLHYEYNEGHDDGATKPTSWFEKSLDFALPIFPLPARQLYVHCTMGVNRGPSTAYAVMIALGFPGPYALSLIKSVRPQAVARYSGDADRAVHELGYV